MSALRDGWRLAVGTLTALPVAAPERVGAAEARAAVLLAPFAVAPLGVAVAAALELARLTGLPALLGGMIAVGILSLGTRAMHWDGLSDVADGLTASYDPERSLAVMKTGTSGPAGTVAVVVVIAVQAVALAGFPGSWRGSLVAGLVVCLSRSALTVCCQRDVPSARPGGLGDAFAGTVGPLPAACWWLAGAAALGAAGAGAGLAWWRGVLAAAFALGTAAVLAHRATRRFGGVTGDVFGAAIELALAAGLVALA